MSVQHLFSVPQLFPGTASC